MEECSLAKYICNFFLSHINNSFTSKLSFNNENDRFVISNIITPIAIFSHYTENILIILFRPWLSNLLTLFIFFGVILIDDPKV